MNEWIKVEDKTPKWGQIVIVYRGKLVCADPWKFNLPPLIETTRNYDNTITHWMPLPEEPNE